MLEYDWIFSAWMLSTIGILLLIFFFLIIVHVRLLKIERRIDLIDQKMFQLALIPHFNRKEVSYKEESNISSEPKKGGWPKGKRRKPVIEIDQ